jgi:hypothetical protein
MKVLYLDAVIIFKIVLPVQVKIFRLTAFHLPEQKSLSAAIGFLYYRLLISATLFGNSNRRIARQENCGYYLLYI